MKPTFHLNNQPESRNAKRKSSFSEHPWQARAMSALTLAGALYWALALNSGAKSQEPSTVAPLSRPAKSWAADCAKKEESVILHPGSYLRYRMHDINQKGDTLRDQIETQQGTVARLIERSGRPLTADEDAAERSRLNAMIASPEDFARHVRRDDEGKKSALDLLRQTSDAMVWSYAPGQPQLAGHPAGDPALIVLDFKPDPKWSAPSMESELLTGLEGRIWIEPRTARLVHMQADIFKAVNVGWGFVAHVYPGGKVTLDQASAGEDRWIVRHFDEQFTLRALLVKSVRQQMTTDTSDYQTVTAMPYQQAIKMLLATPLPR
jgi:hypothetical protein